MKNLITVLCLLCFAGCAFASEAYQVPGSYKEVIVETTTSSAIENAAQVQETTQTKRKWFRRRYRDYNPSNTYWNFGRPPFFTGSI